MNWRIKAIVADTGEDLYIGDSISLGGETTIVETIHIINGMVLINGKVIDIDNITTGEVDVTGNTDDLPGEIIEG